VARAAGVVAAATLLSRILGFARDALIAWTFGAGFSSDAFLAAFRIPNLFRRLVGEGTLNAAFIPVITEALWKGGHDRANALFAAAFRVLAPLLAGVSALGVVAAPWLVTLITPGFSGAKLELTVTLTRLMFPYLLAAGLAALCIAALNVYGCFSAPALAPAVLNIAIIGFLLAVAPRLERPVLGLAAGVLCGGAAQLVWLAPHLLRHRLRVWPRGVVDRADLARMGRLMLPALLGGAVYQVNILAGTLLASLLKEGSVSYLYYADRLVEFPLGVVAMAGATAVLPSLAREAAAGDAGAMGATFGYAFRLVSFIALPAAAGLVLLAEPVVALLFRRGEFGAVDVQLTAQALSYYALGLWAFSVSRVVVSVFFALQKSATPLRAAALSILANLLLGWALMKPLAHCAMALAASLASILNLVLLLAALRHEVAAGQWRGIAGSLGRSLLGSAVMAGGVMALSRVLIPGWREAETLHLAWTVALSVIAGGLLYMASAALLRSPELRGLLGYLTGRDHQR
jgi:putative peptidoglycan lipid II flippase